MNTRKSFLIIALSALISVMGFAPVNFWYFTFFGPVFFIHYLMDGKNGFRKGYIFGFFYSIILVHWLAFNSGAAVWMVTISMVVAALFWALNYAVIAWLSQKIIARNKYLGLLSIPFIWTSVEYIRSFGVLGFPWASIGNTQTANLVFIQMSDIGGIYLVSFILISVNTALYFLYINFKHDISIKLPLAILLALIILPYMYGIAHFNIEYKEKCSHTFRLIQPNYDSHEKWKRSNRNQIFFVMDSLSRAQGIDSVDITIWPESATPVYIRTHRKYRNFVQKYCDDTGTILITGTQDYFLKDKKPKPTNSIFAFEPEKGITASYDKVHLVPFGEYIPLSGYYPALKKLNLGQANFIQGKKNQKFAINNGELILKPMVCYESIFPEPAAIEINRGASYFINCTNDSWFGRSWGPYQHASQAIVRAVESRRPFLRSANTGVTMGLDAHGRVIKMIDLYERGYIDVKVSSPEYISMYSRYPKVFPVLILIILGFIILKSYDFTKKIKIFISHITKKQT